MPDAAVTNAIVDWFDFRSGQRAFDFAQGKL